MAFLLFILKSHYAYAIYVVFEIYVEVRVGVRAFLPTPTRTPITPNSSWLWLHGPGCSTKPVLVITTVCTLLASWHSSCIISSVTSPTTLIAGFGVFSLVYLHFMLCIQVLNMFTFVKVMHLVCNMANLHSKISCPIFCLQDAPDRKMHFFFFHRNL